MLKALESGKLRGLVLAGIDDADGRRRWMEDLVSAAVLGRIAYFPDATVSRLIAGLLGISDDFGALQEFVFWKFFPVPGEDRQVAPDVVIYFERAIVVVEAKRDDGYDMHRPDQLQSELAAVDGGEPEREEHRLVHLIALGGHRDPRASAVPGEAWTRVSWAMLNDAVEAIDAAGPHEGRLKSDIGLALVLHGVRSRPLLYFGTLVRVGLGDLRFRKWGKG